MAQAAAAHAQFETIHPFVDGNGRTGRALIHVILRRRGLASKVLPPISLVLGSWSTDYVNGLTATRYRGTPRSQAAHEGLNRWIGLFAAASRRAVADAEMYERRLDELKSSWRERLGPTRELGGRPPNRGSPWRADFTVQSGAALIGRSEQAVNEAMPRLVDAGILKQVMVGRRNRAFEAAELIDAFTDLERQLAILHVAGEEGIESVPLPGRSG